jgi:DnaK suppressor protein
MTTTKLKLLRRILENKRTELENGSSNREALAIDTSPEELDRIQHANNRDWAMSNLERESSRLREVRAALHRMDADRFGICGECEEDINPKRLVAIPWAALCIVCQEAADQDQKTSLSEALTSFVAAA